MYLSFEFSDANTATLTDPVSTLKDTIRRRQ
jgi:hypothetical protein